MSKSISPAVTVIVIVLVIVIAGLLWYIYTVPRPTQRAGPVEMMKPITPATATNLPEAKAKAAQAERAMEAQQKATMPENKEKVKSEMMKMKAEGKKLGQ